MGSGMPNARPPSGWEQTNLAGLADYVNGFAFNESYWSAEGLPIVRIAQITGSQGIVDRYQGPLPDTYRLDDGDLIFSWSGTLAVVRWHAGPAWLNQHLFKVVPRQGVDRDLLFHLLQASVAEMNKRTHGSTMKHIKRGELREFSVSLPVDAAEQQALAEVLNTLDTTIRQTEAIIEKLKLVKQGLLHDLLTRGIDANGELRPPQSQAPHLYKDSPLGWIPREWEAVRMAEAIRELGQGWSPDCPPEPAAADRWGVLKTTAIVWDGYADHENKALPATLQPRPGLEVAPEDILITRAGPKERVAVVAYVAHTRPRLMISDKMYRLRLREADVPAYFALALSSQYAQAAVKRTISGMADSQTNISQPIIRMIQVMRPPTDEQRAISLRAVALADQLQAEQGQLTALGSLKIGLMDDLLTGRVRVTPLLDAAAHA